MIYKTLGQSAVQIPAIALGTSGTGSYSHFDPDVVEQRIATLRHGIDLGLTFIDTAELYGGGFAEEVTGRAIAGLRDKVFLASKFCPRESPAPSLMESLDASLRRLRTDHLDLYQIHWPNPALPIDRTMELLFRAVEFGKVRFVGVSNFSRRLLDIAQLAFADKIVSDQLEYNLLDRSAEEMLPYCRERHVTLLAYSPLNQGKILGGSEDQALLGSIAAKYDKSIAQVVLQWLVSHAPVVAVTKTTQIKRIREHAEAMDFVLAPEDLARISDLPRVRILEVPLTAIRLVAPAHRTVYATAADALRNRQDLLPSPKALARLITDGDYKKPIRLTPTTDRSGKYQYDIDQYDVMDQVKKYWAWHIAFGQDVAIPAYILPSEASTSPNDL